MQYSGFDATGTGGTFQIRNLIINGTVNTTSTTGVEEAADETSFSVFPNPAAGDVHLTYHLFEAANVSLSIYDMLGRQVEVVRGEAQAAGDHEYQSTVRLPGVYFARLTVGGKTICQRFVRM